MADAEYQLTCCDNAYSMSVPLWTVVPLSKTSQFLYGIVPECTVVGRVEGQGGRRNHTISWVDGGFWEFWHLGHSLPIFINDTSQKQHALKTGDVVCPGPGIAFTFSIPSELAPFMKLLDDEGPAVVERPEPLIDHAIGVLGYDLLQAQRILKAVIARRRGLPMAPR